MKIAPRYKSFASCNTVKTFKKNNEMEYLFSNIIIETINFRFDATRCWNCNAN